MHIPSMIDSFLYLVWNVPEARFTGLPAVLHKTYVDACQKMKWHTTHQKLVVDDNKLLKLNDKWWIPRNLYEVIWWLVWYHHIAEGTHYGVNETIKRIRSNYEFEYMDAIARISVKSRPVCQENKPSNYTPINYNYTATPSQPNCLMNAHHITDL